MPTCKFSPIMTLPKSHGAHPLPKLSFYDARHWNGPEGQFRVMAGTKWIKLDGRSRSFFTLDGLTKLIMNHLSKGLGFPGTAPQVSPLVEEKTPVRYIPPDCPEQAINTAISLIPTQDDSGEWVTRLFYVKGLVPLRHLRYLE